MPNEHDENANATTTPQDPPAGRPVIQGEEPPPSPPSWRSWFFPVISGVTLTVLFAYLAWVGQNLVNLRSDVLATKALVEPSGPVSVTKRLLDNQGAIKRSTYHLARLVRAIHETISEREIIDLYTDEINNEFNEVASLVNPLKDPRVAIKPSEQVKGMYAFTLPKDGPPSEDAFVMAAGRVTDVFESEEDDGMFWTVEITDELGYRYLYAHLAERSLNNGDPVNADVVVGKVARASPVCVRVGVYPPGGSAPIDFRSLISE